MPVSKPFTETIYEQLKSLSFRRTYLRGTMECLVAGEIETGKTLLLDYVNGTIGFTKLSEALGQSSASLKRMLSPSGNPSLSNFFEVTTYLQKIDGTVLEVIDKNASRSKKAA